MAKPDLMQVGAIVAVIWGIDQGGKGKLPPSLQKYYDKYIGRSGSSSGSGGGSGGGGSSNCDSASIATWSQGINLPTWVGTLFCSDNGHLPTSNAELVNWGTQKGYRDSSGGWHQPTSS